ncbi:MAG: tetratricopeptide repeat protein 38 family protein [Anaerolinea sp.]|nr:tetratricopeptide repeat protein 38 family protein [Anaerolinea sp.]
MPALNDRYGLPITASSTAAADHYIKAVDFALASDAPAEATFDLALEADAGFAMAHAAKARLAQFRGAFTEARSGIAKARELAARATHRERQHIEIIAAAVEGDPARSLELLHEHLRDFPRDAFVLSQACGVYGLIGFSGRTGRNEEQLALLEPLAPAYGEDWWFLSMHAFALNELWRHEEARELTVRSLKQNERNGHASHIMAHVQYETGEVEAGVRFLDSWIPGYNPGAQLFGHLHWHLALFELTAGNYERALELYRTVLRPPGPPQAAALGVLADAAALLWRAGMTEVDPATLPWPELAEFAAKSFPRPGVTWADMHCALAYAGANDGVRLGQHIDVLRERVSEGKVPAGAMVIPLAEGIAAYGAGDYETAVRLLAPIRDEVIRIGGSHAQRDVFEETLLESYLRAGRFEQAEALLRERLDRRPNPRDERWLARAHAQRQAMTAS